MSPSLGKTHWIKWLYLWNRYYIVVVQSCAIPTLFAGQVIAYRICPVRRILLYQRSLVSDHHTVFSHKACVLWFRWRAISQPVQLAFVQPVLIARGLSRVFLSRCLQPTINHYATVRALYNCSRPITIILLLFYAAEVVNLLVLSCTLLQRVEIDFSCFPPWNDVWSKKFYTATMWVSPPPPASAPALHTRHSTLRC